ncbi:uncharacterized protein LOC133725249 [Rosa rugosa]|uniref:uncharacterized protein LOC133725249 n=1 Tax=Rosa rugosa TaxID=74645 RepID=UPI002B4183C9|nr:uncharacterized protein LOC133725249 [Rosa rugosa]XP_062008406.1 uncharacterized protein LOC133725249 [Rosa rugosa]XP_062008407.1 uncharacterized protein LOC133725249 [Rosa rugosa]
MEDEKLQKSKKWLHDLSTGAKGINELEALTHVGLQVMNARKGFFRCNFIVPDHLSDQDGNWHVGAIATVIDDVGAATVYSTVGDVKSVDFTISYYSRVKTREEVELEAEIVGDMGKLICVVVKVTRKENGERVALGKQWMASFSMRTNQSQVTSRL